MVQEGLPTLRVLLKMTKYRMLLWKLGMIKETECPYCRKDLVPHYDYDNEGALVYTCDTKNCEFNKG